MNKRILSIVLALMLVWSLSVPAFAADQESRASCSHTSTQTTVTTSYAKYSATLHSYTTTTTLKCKSCGTVISTTTKTGAKSHTFVKTYQNSVHTGAPKTHYARYTNECQACHYTTETTDLLGCTSSGCVNIQSTPTEVA
jgi:hypothetical protein